MKVTSKAVLGFFQHSSNRFYCRKRQQGASATEFLVTLPALLLLGLGTWQSALIYNAKTTLNYATFEAARTGAVEHAQSDPMRKELGLRLAPLFGGDGSAQKAMSAITRASLDTQNRLYTQIDIISPTSEAFDDFGTEIVNPRTGEVKFGIPNSHLRYRDRAIKTSSGVNVQDANLLKIKTTYGYKLNVPLMDRVIPAVMTRIDPGNSKYYIAGRLPITSVATVRMQSDAWKDDNGNAGGGDGGGVIPPGDPGNPPDDGDDGQGGDGDGDIGGDDGSSGGDDTTTGDDDTNNGGCSTCGQTASPQSSPVSQSNNQVSLIDDSASGQICPVNTQTGNPIHVATGNKYQQESDLKPLSGSLGLSFIRNYNSQSSHKGVLGYNWTHSYDHRLSYRSDIDSYHLKQGDGRGIVFTPGEKTGQYIPSRVADGWLMANGNQAIWHHRDGRKFKYNASGQLHSITATDGKTLSLQYNTQQQLFLIRDPQQRELALSYYPNGRLKAILDPTGQTTRYRYSNKGNLASVTYADKTTRTYHYEDSRHSHALTGITDQRGIRYASWQYDEQGRAIESTHIDNVGKVSLDFSIEGQTSIIDSQGKVSIYYTENLHGTEIVTRIDGPGCSSCGNGDAQYEYNDQLQLTKVTQKNGNATHYAYDEQGRTIRITKSTLTGASQLIARYEYDSENLKPSTILRPSINPAGDHRVEISYNAIQQPISVTEFGYRPIDNNGYAPISRTTRLSYENGNLTTIDGPREDVKDLIQLSYDQKQRLKTLTGPDGLPLTVKNYDDYGRPTQIQSGTQSPIYIQYNDKGQIEKVSQYSQSVSYRYTATGKLKSLTSPEGETLSIDYDEADRAIGMTGPDGSRVEDQIDSEGRLVERNLLGSNGQLIQSLSNLYDAKGRLQSRSKNGQLTKQYDYDESGQLTQVTDGAGNNTRINYGPLGQLQSLNGPDQSQLTLHYDDKGQTAGVTDPRNNTTTQLKDDFGNLVLQSNPDSGIVSFQYDSADNLIQKSDAAGNVTQYSWDAADRLIQVQGKDEDTSLSYDPQSGRLSLIKSASSSETFKYDTEGQLITHTRSIDGHAFATAFAYDPETQKLSQKTLPDGQVLNYHYYSATDDPKQQGALRAITRQTLFGFDQQTVIGEIDHDKTDGTTGHTYGNGIRTEYHWDGAGQLAHISNNQTLELHYRYDPAGNITGIDLNGQQQTYLYDADGRLVSADTLLGQFGYRYDRLGNRRVKQHTDNAGNTVTETYRYAEEGQGNRLLAIEKRAAGEADNLSYNQAGSLTQSDGLSYDYNSQQRPVKVYQEQAGEKQLIAEYAYNRFGERIKKTVYQGDAKQPKITFYLYDGDTVAAEANDQGEITAQYLYLNGYRPIAKLEHKQVYAIHSDHIGTPRIATNAQGETVWSADYSPFGKAEIKIEQISLNLRFAGQYEDTETGKYYNYLRTYDPDTGRYQTSDPIGLEGGLNTYAYVRNNPQGAIDPLGLELVNPLPDPAGDLGELILDSKTEEGETAEDGDSYFDQLKDKGGKILDWTMNNLAGDENYHMALNMVVSKLPDTFRDMKPTAGDIADDMIGFMGNGGYTTIVEVAVSMAAIASIDKAANVMSLFGGIVGKGAKWLAKKGLKKAMTLALAAEFGGRAVEMFEYFLEEMPDQMKQVAELIEEINENPPPPNSCHIKAGELDSLTDDIARQLAEKMLSVASDIGVGRFGKLTDKLNLKKKDKKDDDDIYKGCSGTYKFGVRPNGKPINMPRCSKSSGTWGNAKNTGKQGDSVFLVHKTGTSIKYTNLRKALNKYNDKGIRYKKGYPVLDDYRYSNNGIPADVDIEIFSQPRNDTVDFNKADEEYRKLIGDPNWKRPDGYTWHHHQEQGRMQLIDSKIHNNLPHCGGVGCYN